MKTVEITEGMTVEEIIELLNKLGDVKFKHHVFKVRGTIDLAFEEDSND